MVVFVEGRELENPEENIDMWKRRDKAREFDLSWSSDFSL